MSKIMTSNNNKSVRIGCLDNTGGIRTRIYLNRLNYFQILLIIYEYIKLALYLRYFQPCYARSVTQLPDPGLDLQATNYI